MKIYIPNCFSDPNKLKGKSLFCYRLGTALEEKGIDITDDSNINVDVSLNIIGIKHEKSRIKLLRLDGVWHDTGKAFVKKNKGMIASLKRADGVVYQSQFSRNMCDRYLGEPISPCRVIPNGSYPGYYHQVKAEVFNGKKVFITFSKWRPHKRLRDIIHSFLLANVPNSILLVAGDTTRSGVDREELDYFFNLSSIQYVGNVEQRMLASLLKASIASIHLCWFDSCPNSVVEALCAGTPVICNNVGGTWELVGPSGGFVCDIDSPYDMNPVDLYHPPKINRRVVAEAIRECAKKRPVVNNDFVNIDNVAERYLEFIEEIL